MPEVLALTTPIVVDERIRECNLTLTDFRRAIPQQYLQPSPVRSWWTLLRVCILLGICVEMIRRLDSGLDPQSLTRFPLLVVVWVTYGWSLVGLFVIGHDCGHQSFSSRKWVNEIVGHLAMSPLGSGFHAWKLTHNQHHAYTQLRGREVDWASFLVTREEFHSGKRCSRITRLGYRLPFGIALWVGWNTIRRGFMIRTLIPPQQFAIERRRLIWSGAIMAATLFAIYGGLWYACGYWGMLKYFGIPAVIANITGSVIITIQHANEHSLLFDKAHWSPVRGQIVSTFNVRFPRLLEFLWFDINIHIPHHIAPAIPWYYLRRTSRILHQAFPDCYQEQRFGWKHLAWWRRTPFLEKVDAEGYYLFS